MRSELKNHNVYLYHWKKNGQPCYAGQTELPIEQRHRQHLNGTQFFDRVALQIYGDDAFILETIAEGLTLEAANEMERYLINKYQLFTSGKGFNRTSGGKGARNEYPPDDPATWDPIPVMPEGLSNIQKMAWKGNHLRNVNGGGSMLPTWGTRLRKALAAGKISQDTFELLQTTWRQARGIRSEPCPNREVANAVNLMMSMIMKIKGI